MNFILYLVKFLSILVSLMPQKLCDALSAAVGLIYYWLTPASRAVIRTNLRHALHTESPSRRQIDRLVLRTYFNYARRLTDFYRLTTLSREQVIRLVEEINVDHLDRALAQGRGVVMLTLHLGNWDYAGAYLAARGYPMNALVEEMDPGLLDFLTHHREATGMRTFTLPKSAYAFLDAIRHNRVLAVVGDRDLLKNGKTVKFFDGHRKIPANLSEIIVRKHIPVTFGYLAFNPKGSKWRYRGVVHKPESFDTAENFERFMILKFEETIKLFPDQWLALQPEWLDQTHEN
jgi:lauroyl/myristoyl acyltransferase